MLTDKYKDLPPPKVDPVFGLDKQAKDDNDPNAVNLVIGAYRGADGKPYILDCVHRAEKIIVDKKMGHEYQPIGGHRGLADAAVRLMFGSDCPPMDTIARVQTLSGTGAIRIAAEIFRRCLPMNTEVYISEPTWANHRGVFWDSGFHNIKQYRYFDHDTLGVDFKGMSDDLMAAPKNSLVIFHLCAHNPTGADPTKEQWSQLADVCIARKLNVIFDAAYQGYATGDLDNDAAAARLFVKRGIEIAVCQSFAKNMGLYGERVGTMSFVCGSADSAKLIEGLMKNPIRTMYSNPPLHGARIAHLILTDRDLNAEWVDELRSMAERIARMRSLVEEELKRLGTPGDWSHITAQIGMFSYLGLTPQQCERLQTHHHIYIMPTGRANMAGLTESTALRLAAGIDDAVRFVPKKDVVRPPFQRNLCVS